MVPEAHCKNHPDLYYGVVRCSRCRDWICPNCRVEIEGRPYCAECKSEYLRDLRAGVTGIGVAQLNLASVGRRFGALFLDGLIFTIPYAAFMIYVAVTASPEAAGSDDIAAGPVIGIILVVLWLTAGRVVYEGLMLSRGGQTLGKRALSLKVVTPEGHDLRPGQAWGRALMRLVLENCLSFVNYIPALFTKEKTAIHDLVAKTRVIDLRHTGLRLVTPASAPPITPGA